MFFSANAEGASGVITSLRAPSQEPPPSKTTAVAHKGPFGPDILVRFAGGYVAFYPDTPYFRDGIRQEFGCEVENEADCPATQTNQPDSGE